MDVFHFFPGGSPNQRTFQERKCRFSKPLLRGPRLETDPNRLTLQMTSSVRPRHPRHHQAPGRHVHNAKICEVRNHRPSQISNLCSCSVRPSTAEVPNVTPPQEAASSHLERAAYHPHAMTESVEAYQKCRLDTSGHVCTLQSIPEAPPDPFLASRLDLKK